MNNELSNEYFEWMYRLVCGDSNANISYRRLIDFLHKKIFRYTIVLDSNRAEDGIDLRYRFAREHNIDDRIAAVSLDCNPCSVLEMMLALAIRCEEHVMSNPDYGNRTSQWFWDMIRSLGLIFMDDSKFDKDKADQIIERFLTRNYESNGEGGLFTLRHCRFNLRSVEIWYQAMWYFDEILQYR